MLADILSRFAAACNSSGFFGLPTWYKYLDYRDVTDTVTDRVTCEIAFEISDIPLIGLAIVDIALRLAALIAVGYVIYGGVQLITSQGEADKTKKGRQTIINALVGLVIAMLATGVVVFIGNRFGD